MLQRVATSILSGRPGGRGRRPGDDGSGAGWFWGPRSTGECRRERVVDVENDTVAAPSGGEAGDCQPATDEERGDDEEA